MDERAFFPFSPSDIYAFLFNNMGGMSALELYAIAKRIDGAPSIFMIS
jgi:dihydroxyacetone kinase